MTMSIPSALSSDDASIAEMKRTAIDSSGRLGSLYEAYRDRLVGQLGVDNQKTLDESDTTIQGEIKYGDDDQPQNLLRRLSINEQLRLSILLNLTSSGGITSLIDYAHLTNEYTRLFCYSYLNRVQRLPDQLENAEQFIHSSASLNTATHLITGIEYGIDLVVVLQLPIDANTVQGIDHVLEKLLSFLLHNDVDDTLTPGEENLLKSIVCTKVYSNISDLNNLTTVLDVCLGVKKNINNLIDYPISYILRPIKWLHPQYNGGSAKFIPVSIELNEQIEDYVVQLSADVKNFEIAIVEDASQLIDEDFKQRLSEIKQKFMDEIKELANKVIEIRTGRNENLAMEQILNINEQTTIQESIHDLAQTLKDLKEKEQLQYSNLNTKDDMIDTENKMLTNHQPIRDTHDCLNKNNSGHSKRSRSDSEEESKNNSVDISHMTILKSPEEIHENMDDSTTHPSSTTAQTPSPSLSESHIPVSSPKDECETINILLLGETGVGKSTFINAFANYLTFNTLQQAETNQSVVLIPVSFLVTVGDNFDEHIVQFGNVDDSENEDFNHPGQSVTQHCKSYLFNLNHDRGHRQKLCIIDTPGFGDTRGIDQDDYNIAHILEYIQNLPHLDAICFLLKPNESRLNIFYRSCLMQLSSFRQSKSCDNILFCFTNARSTFYTPGDTAPLLRKMLSLLPTGDVQFKKVNTFCFDSESFRYLVALQNGILFNELERGEYEMSWTKSAFESNRLIHYICKILTLHRIKGE